MPVTPVHDLAIKDNDLVAATHGRSFWILDDISPLRQISGQTSPAPAVLFAPGKAVRVRASTNHDTPLTPEVPAGENPPPGAILYYYLKSPAQNEVRIEILDSHDQVVRVYSSRDKDKPWSPTTPPPFPMYWFRPAQTVDIGAGMHRLVWDLRYAPPPVASPGYSMSTVFGRSVPLEPEGPSALPGSYRVRLVAGGQSYQQPLTVTMDPRVPVSPQDLEKQFLLESRLAKGISDANQAATEVHASRAAGKIDEATERKFAGGGRRGGGEAGGGGGDRHVTFDQISGTLAQLLTVVDSADAAPTSQAVQASEEAFVQLQRLLVEWRQIKP
jgi:hypothetical protein